MAKKTAAKKRAPKKSSEPYTHIDRSNGTYLRKSELDPKKPHLSPVSKLATVEELTPEEAEAANA